MKRLIVAALIVLAGCANPPDPVIPPPGPAVQGQDNFPGCTRRAVVAGLTAVDPAAYDGWAGNCPGCDVDAEVFAMLCRQYGVSTVELHNEQATKAGLLSYGRAAWQGMKPGDLFVLYISGHGGQVEDTSGDEADLQDETMCLWDGELTDDVLAEYWLEMPVGVRVFFVTDTCNSGTNYRARGLRRTMTRDYPGMQLIHYGGCADGQSSMGGPQGGAFTTALVDGWKDSLAYGGDGSWFAVSAAKMTRKQVPQYEEYGPVTDAFRNNLALR